MMAWLLHRLSGLALVGYLLLHLYDLRAAQQSRAAFDQALAFFQTPFWKIMDLLLVAVVLYHTLNGIRLLLFDSGSMRAIRYQRQLFWRYLIVVRCVRFVISASSSGSLSA
jgi:succinate dehydrogenase / fumarate reductase cytochrome b subunit